MKKVVIIDYDMGNLFSVRQACENVGLHTVISNDRKEINSCDAIILPGVGSFKEAMLHLKQFDLVETIKTIARQEIPFLGICLGMQLLFSESEEFGHTTGLELIKGKVKKFPATNEKQERNKIPQMNWNTIHFPKGMQEFGNPLLRHINNHDYMYFVHSYYVVNEEPETISCLTNYGGVEYCSGLHKGNIMAFQFHPEKSAGSGLKIYSNFKNLIENGTK